MEKKKSKIIALDFDGCLMTDKWPKLGEPIIHNINKVKEEIKRGAKIVLWTCRTGEALEQAVAFCEHFDIKLSGINENLPEIIDKYQGDSRKIMADEYWDDKSVLRSEKEKSLVITICGGTSFKKDILEVQYNLTLAGHVVLSLPFFDHADNLDMSDFQIAMLVDLHLQKIDMSDFIYVVNKNKYIGDGTASEILYAKKLGKGIIYMEP